MNIEEAKKKLLEPQKIPLVEIIRKFKREGIENFLITPPEIVETLLTAYEKEKEKNKELESRLNTIKDIYFNTNDLEKLSDVLGDLLSNLKEE